MSLKQLVAIDKNIHSLSLKVNDVKEFDHLLRSQDRAMVHNALKYLQRQKLQTYLSGSVVMGPLQHKNFNRNYFDIDLLAIGDSSSVERVAKELSNQEKISPLSYAPVELSVYNEGTCLYNGTQVQHRFTAFQLHTENDTNLDLCLLTNEKFKSALKNYAKSYC